MKRVGGTPVRFVSERCDPRVLREGRTTRYAGCLVRVSAAGTTVTKRYSSPAASALTLEELGALGTMLDLLSLSEEDRILGDVRGEIRHALEVAADEQEFE